MCLRICVAWEACPSHQHEQVARLLVLYRLHSQQQGTQCPPRRVQQHQDSVACTRQPNAQCQTQNPRLKTQRKRAETLPPTRPPPDVIQLVIASAGRRRRRRYPLWAQGLPGTRWDKPDSIHPPACHCLRGTKLSDSLRALPSPIYSQASHLIPSLPFVHHHQSNPVMLWYALCRWKLSPKPRLLFRYATPSRSFSIMPIHK